MKNKLHEVNIGFVGYEFGVLTDRIGNRYSVNSLTFSLAFDAFQFDVGTKEVNFLPDYDVTNLSGIGFFSEITAIYG